MELYEYARPEVLSGKTILYVHGFASSGQNGSVKALRVLFPEAEVIAPDLPVDPHEAMAMLTEIMAEQRPDVVIGTSMGAMYAEQLRSADGSHVYKVLVNPAFHLADTILKNNGLGRREYHNARKDGETSFLVNKGLLEAFRDVSSHAFGNLDEDCLQDTWFLFGRNDSLVDCREETNGHYPQCIQFDGEHYLNDEVMLRSVMPVLQWIHDRIAGKEKPAIFISCPDVLRYSHNTEEVAGARKALHSLDRLYSLQFVLYADQNHMEQTRKLADELYVHFGVPLYGRMFITPGKKMLLGDYLIDAHAHECGGEEFMGTLIEFGSDSFKTWDDVLTYFDRLGGQ